MARRSTGVVVRRRLLAGAALLVALAVVAVAAVALTGDDDAKREAAATPTPPPKPLELPRGGRTLLPRYRIVAYYGAPQARELGALGIGSPDAAARRLIRQTKPYERPRRPVLPAMELIAVIANADPGEDGNYRSRQTNGVIRRYLRAARRHRMLLVLDIQPGRSDFFTETIRLRHWLREPDVGLALDPEWHVTAPEVPGQVIGHVGSRELNATSAWLDQLVERRDLPQKLFLVHQFTDDMVDTTKLKRRAHLAMVMNADGFGTPPVKISKYRLFTRQTRDIFQGFKLFYEEDVGMMKPRRVLRLHPSPDVVVYE